MKRRTLRALPFGIPCLLNAVLRDAMTVKSVVIQANLCSLMQSGIDTF